MSIIVDTVESFVRTASPVQWLQQIRLQMSVNVEIIIFSKTQI